MKLEVKLPCCPKCAVKKAGRHSVVWLLAGATLLGLGGLRVLRWLFDEGYGSIGEEKF
jgi:hypothetical protein